MPTRVVLTAAMLLLASPLSACIWLYGTDLRGKEKVVEGFIGSELAPGRDAKAWAFRRGVLEGKLRQKQDRETRSDHAVALLHTGEAARARDIFLALEREKPGEYENAANLGTAYELAGDDVNALLWIRESVRRNRFAHYGTEWLHVRILEAKLAHARDPQWLETHSILGLDFGTGKLATRPKKLPPGNTGEPVPEHELLMALHYQLRERMEFVDPPDPYVGALLFDYANLATHAETVESAIHLFELALRYGTPRAALAKERLARLKTVKILPKKK